MTDEKVPIEFECSKKLRDAFDQAAQQEYGLKNARSLALRNSMRIYCEIHGTLPKSP